MIMIERNQSDHQLLGHDSNQDPSPSIAQFGQEAAEESQLFQTSSFKDYGGYASIPSIQQNCFVVFPRSMF